jgi:hypothetical protein
MTEREEDSYAMKMVSLELRADKLNYGMIRWYRLKTKFNLQEIQNKNNVILFEINDIKFYYACRKQKIRKQGSPEWTSKLETYLKKESGCIKVDCVEPLTKKEKTIPNPTDKAPGKHKDKTWLEVKEQDPNYIEWMIGATKDNLLKKMLSLI